MEYVIENSDAHLVIPLLRNDLPVLPDVNSVTYTINDNEGVPITGYIDLALATPAGTTQLAIPSPAAVNTITVGKSFERRTVVAKFLQGGKQQRFTTTFRVVPFLQHSVTPARVRAFLGLKGSELSDEDIDLTAAYFTVQADFLPAVLGTILTSGDITELAADEAIRMQAVIDVLPSVRQRLAQMESNGVWQFQRAQVGKLDGIEKEARSRYSQARATATGSGEEVLTYVLTTLDTDTITGE